MRQLGRIVFFLILIVASTFLFLDLNLHDESDEREQTELPQLESKQVAKKIEFHADDGVFSLMGQSVADIVDALGEPKRKDPSAYGYTWWIYQGQGVYMQLGIENGKVQTIFATGEQLESAPLPIGTAYEKIAEQFPFQAKVTYQKGISHYSFLLNDNDIQEQPLIALADDVFVQCYFDTYTNKLSSLRIASGDILTRQRFYEMEYRGTLPTSPELSDIDWERVERGMEEQIFDLTNMYRETHGIPALQFERELSEVALLHSKDMFEQQYFSHQSLDGRGLKERIEEKDLYYLAAGENIAAQHLDAPAATEGWLNSEGHRETLLSEQYNFLGVGVYRLYYTQNFLLKP